MSAPEYDLYCVAYRPAVLHSGWVQISSRYTRAIPPTHSHRPSLTDDAIFSSKSYDAIFSYGMEHMQPALSPPDLISVMNQSMSRSMAPSPPSMSPPDAALLNNIALANRMMSLQANQAPKVS